MSGKSGLIFNIVHGSFVDGYGVRTTIFLKGCPLKCIWCCNPEGQDVRPEIKFIHSRCDECGRCIGVCPTGAIEYDHSSAKNRLKISRELCTSCGKCIEVCRLRALQIVGEYVSVKQLFEIVKRNEQFFRDSNGGVTIGGGEPTFQSSFTLEFIRECKNNYIHTAVDTCGYTLTHEAFSVLAEADLILFDLKGVHTERHLKNTGVSNEIILNNLKKLGELRKPIIIRMPLIPDYTDFMEDINAMADLLSKMKTIERIDLLSYHEFGKIKYQQLGKRYRLNTKNISQEKVENIQRQLELCGLIVQIGG